MSRSQKNKFGKIYPKWEKEVSSLVDKLKEAKTAEKSCIINLDQRWGIDPEVKKHEEDDYIDYDFLKDNPRVPVYVREKK